MLPILITAILAAVVTAESSSVTSYSGNPSSLRDYEFAASNYYSSGKPSYDLGTTYITSGSSPYAKSDSRYSSDSNTDSTDPRNSLANSGSSGSSFYKSKYGNEAVVNSLRPSYAVAPSGSSVSSEASSNPSSGHYSSIDYSSSHGSSNIGAPGSASSSSSSSSSTSGLTSNDYSGGASSGGFTGSSYGERSPDFHSHPAFAEASSGVQSEYPAAPPAPGRSPGSIYSSYADYSQNRPTATYTSHGSSSGSLSSPVSSSLSVSDFGGRHPQQQYTLPEDFGHSSHGPPAHPMPYKSYIMSSGPSSYSPSKYQSVFGAIKSLFGVGPSLMSDASTSASHLPLNYPGAGQGPAAPPSHPSAAAAAYYSAGHHPAPSSASTGYYFGSGPSVSGNGGSAYAKSYPAMRLVPAGYGGAPGAGGVGGGKIIVVRESVGAHSPGYPSSAAGILGSPGSAYAVKGKLAAYAPTSSGGHYAAPSAPSSLSYTSGPSSSYPGSYSSSSSFAGGHGGSTFLGYSA